MNQQTIFTLGNQLMWWLPTQASHQMEATYELTYFNGTNHKKIIQSFQLNIIVEES